jgi:hypothetical protein
MYSAAARLRQAVSAAMPRLGALTPEEASLRPAPGKWCPAEIIGHLIDSATNNHRRFVLGQLQDDLVFPGYDQDAWVRVQCYRDAPWEELVASWRALNLRIAHVMEAAGDPARTRPRHPHSLDRIAFSPVPEDRPATLGALMEDYVDHLEHHLRQIGGSCT